MQKSGKNIADFSGNMNDIWRLLNAEERAKVRAHATILHYKKNQQIYSEGDEPKYLMCLLSGKVKIYKGGVSGRNQIVRFIKPVQYFAFRAYFAQEKYMTAASAFEPSKVCLIPMHVVCEIMEHNHNICRFFIKLLSITLGVADERTVNLTQKHLRGRLAESLVFLMDSYGLDEDASINIYLAREDLANLSNMTTSNAIRTLSMFVNEKVIVMDGRRIKVMDEEKLRKISRLG